MKAISIAVIVAWGTIVQAQTVSVKGNTKLNTDFSQYKTFSWAQSDGTLPAEVYQIYSFHPELKSVKKSRKDIKHKESGYYYSYNVIIPATNSSINTVLQNSIDEELEGRGFVENVNPDLIIAYKVLEKRARMKGYKNDVPTMVGANEVHQPSDTATFTLEPGTLFISLVDTKTSEVVWDGFASGLFQENAFISDEQKLKEAVHLVFNEFKFRGDRIKVDN